ncbi:hypothetical protein ACFX2I_040990 [Malus domestica]
MPIEKKRKTSSAAYEGSPTADRLVIDLISSKGKKDEATRSEPVMPTMPKVANTIANRIAQHRDCVVPLVPKSVTRHSLGVKSGSYLERLATMKSDKVDSAAKVTQRPTPLTAEKDETARVDSCEKSTKLVYGEATEIHALLKPDLLKDMDPYVKFIDGIKGVVCPSSFMKHTTQYKRTALLAMMQKTKILVGESMFLDQKDTKATKEMAKNMAIEAYSFKRSNISAPTSLQLKIARQEIVDLKTRLDVIQVKYENAKKEIGCYIPQIQDLERAIFKLRYTSYARDE